jgi:competence ComEA-like helix-hairpin-helix protein
MSRNHPRRVEKVTHRPEPNAHRPTGHGRTHPDVRHDRDPLASSDRHRGTPPSSTPFLGDSVCMPVQPPPTWFPTRQAPLAHVRSVYLPPGAERATWLVMGSLTIALGIGLVTARFHPPCPLHGHPCLQVDVNQSSKSILAVLPGIGPHRAAAIIRHREQHGRFQEPEDLLAVPGIGPATLERMRPFLETCKAWRLESDTQRNCEPKDNGTSLSRSWLPGVNRISSGSVTPGPEPK